MKCKRCGKEMDYPNIGRWQAEAEFGLNFEVDDCNGYTRGFRLCKVCTDSFERFLVLMPTTKEDPRD